MGSGKKHKGRPGRNPSVEQAKLKEMLGNLNAPAEQLKHTIVELQVINNQLHAANKVLTQTLKEMLGEFHDRLAAVELEQFGEVRGNFDKYLAKEETDVQLSEVRGDDSGETGDAEAGETADGRGQGNEDEAPGDPEGDSTLH